MKLILSESPAKLGVFEKPPVSSKSKALVYENRKNELLVIKNGDHITKSEIRHGNYHTVYCVNMGIEDFGFEKEYPSENEVEQIRIKLNISFRIIEPKRIIEAQLSDPQLKIENDMELFINKITRRYSVYQLLGLEDQLNDLVHDDSLTSKLENRGIEITDITSFVSSSEERKQELKSYDSLHKTTAYKTKEMESQSTLIELEREQKLKELDYVTGVYRDSGYLGAKTVFRDDDKLTAILEEIHQQLQDRKDKAEQREQKHQDSLKDFIYGSINKGDSPEEIKEKLILLNSVGYEKEKEIDEPNPEKIASNKDRLNEKLKNLESTEGN
ncbi:hypothetical protein GH741_00600 [Aquibacillus halophilus]|uniref:SPFH domain-containing protein n=1 Tax=Aquibacillus halophilus TaxID=930132 RepID=A0A6A8DIN8_9BACI|nr:hypothetical protein [Aquibacillus halophilus]MRH41172.1 hypothetical protein [Aquibacillus halophilus]